MRIAAFGLRCKRAGGRLSMDSVGDSYDNALCESFFATLEYELFDRTSRTHAEARLEIFDYIEGFYNQRLRHSSLDYISPVTFENNASVAAHAARSPRDSGVESPAATRGDRSGAG